MGTYRKAAEGLALRRFLLRLLLFASVVIGNVMPIAAHHICHAFELVVCREFFQPGNHRGWRVVRARLRDELIAGGWIVNPSQEVAEFPEPNPLACLSRLG
jgi:hypothetical protein